MIYSVGRGVEAVAAALHDARASGTDLCSITLDQFRWVENRCEFASVLTAIDLGIRDLQGVES